MRSRFDDHWARGFEVCDSVDEDGHVRHRLRRRSDGSILPVLFAEEDVREEKRRDMWWI